jgi:hypothetical protein
VFQRGFCDFAAVSQVEVLEMWAFVGEMLQNCVCELQDIAEVQAVQMGKLVSNVEDRFGVQ